MRSYILNYKKSKVVCLPGLTNPMNRSRLCIYDQRKKKGAFKHRLYKDLKKATHIMYVNDKLITVKIQDVEDNVHQGAPRVHCHTSGCLGKSAGILQDGPGSLGDSIPQTLWATLRSSAILEDSSRLPHTSTTVAADHGGSLVDIIPSIPDLYWSYPLYTLCEWPFLASLALLKFLHSLHLEVIFLFLFWVREPTCEECLILPGGGL